MYYIEWDRQECSVWYISWDPDYYFLHCLQREIPGDRHVPVVVAIIGIPKIPVDSCWNTVFFGTEAAFYKLEAAICVLEELNMQGGIQQGRRVGGLVCMLQSAT